MSEFAIETHDGRTGFEPGETVDLLVAWKLEEAPESVEVRTCWMTWGKGSRDVAVVQTERLEAPRAAEGRRLRLELPRHPYSFSGKLVSLVWFLEVVALPSKEGNHLNITIAPGGQEILLHGAGGSAPR